MCVYGFCNNWDCRLYYLPRHFGSDIFLFSLYNDWRWHSLPRQCGSDLCVLYVRTIDDTCLSDIVGLICVCILFLFRIQNMKMIDGKPEYTGAFVRQFFTSLCLHVCWFGFCLSVVIFSYHYHTCCHFGWVANFDGTGTLEYTKEQT